MAKRSFHSSGIASTNNLNTPLQLVMNSHSPPDTILTDLEEEDEVELDTDIEEGDDLENEEEDDNEDDEDSENSQERGEKTDDDGEEDNDDEKSEEDLRYKIFKII